MGAAIAIIPKLNQTYLQSEPSSEQNMVMKAPDSIAVPDIAINIGIVARAM